MQIHLVQFDITWENTAANFERVRALLTGRPPRPLSLVVLPEMFSVGFTMNVEAVGEAEGGATESFLRELARSYGCYVVGGLVERTASGKGRNVALALSPTGEILGRYAKLHPFSYAGETEHFEPGGEIVTFDWEGLSTAPFICYDVRFPEIYRLAMRRGARLFLTIANFPSSRVNHWTTLLIARAIENQAYVAGVNRSGSDPNASYPGSSIVVDPKGEIIAQAGAGEEVLVAEIDPNTLARYRESFPVLRDVRQDMLGRA